MNIENSSSLELAIGCINMKLMEKALLSASRPMCIFVFVYFSFLFCRLCIPLPVTISRAFTLVLLGMD